MIKRESYLKKIRPFYDQDIIKVITGIRRCGKSVILKQIIDEIEKTGVKKENIIYYPNYMVTFLNKEKKLGDMIYKLDLSALIE